jgi:putative hydrolase of the HAD superfamily
MFKELFILSFCFFCCFTAQVYTTTKSQIKAVVFDFGGVISNANREPIIKFLMDTFDISEKELAIALNKMKEFIAKDGLEDEFWNKYALSRYIVLPSGWFTLYESIKMSVFIEIPQTMKIVKELQSQGYLTPMLSNVSDYQAKIIRRLGYYDYFNPVLLSYEIGCEKPDAQAYQTLLERLKLSASAVLFVDDLKANVDAAKKVGIDSIEFINGEQLRKELEKRGILLAAPLVR